MKPEQFTQRALEAISEANELAKQHNHSQIGWQNSIIIARLR